MDTVVRSSSPDLASVEGGALQSGAVSELQSAQSGSFSPASPDGISSQVPESPSSQSFQESSVVIHDDTEGDTTGGSLFEDISIGGGLVEGDLLRGLGASALGGDNPTKPSSVTSTLHPAVDSGGVMTDAGSGGELSSLEMVARSSSDTLSHSASTEATSAAPSPDLARRGPPSPHFSHTTAKPRVVSSGSATGSSVRPSLSPIREPSASGDSAAGEAAAGACAHLDPTAHVFAPPAAGDGQAELSGESAVVDRFEILVDKTKEEWGDLSKAGRQALGELGLKSIPSMHGPLSLPYARCPSGIDAFLFSADKDEDPWTFCLDGDDPKARRTAGAGFRVNPVPLPGNARYSQPGFRQHQLAASARAGGSAITSSGRSVRNVSGGSYQGHTGGGGSGGGGGGGAGAGAGGGLDRSASSSWRSGPMGMSGASSMDGWGRGGMDKGGSEGTHWIEQVMEQQRETGAPHQDGQVSRLLRQIKGIDVRVVEREDSVWYQFPQYLAGPPNGVPYYHVGYPGQGIGPTGPSQAQLPVGHPFGTQQQPNQPQSQPQTAPINYGFASPPTVGGFGHVSAPWPGGYPHANPYAANMAAVGINPAGGLMNQSFPLGPNAAAALIAASYAPALATASPWMGQSLGLAAGGLAMPSMAGKGAGVSAPSYDPAILAYGSQSQVPMPMLPAHQGQRDLVRYDFDATETDGDADGDGDGDDGGTESGFSFPDTGHSRRNSVNVRPAKPDMGRRNSAAATVPQRGAGGYKQDSPGAGSRKASLAPAVAVAPRRSSIAPQTRLVRDSGATSTTPSKHVAIAAQDATPYHQDKAGGAGGGHHGRRPSEAQAAPVDNAIILSAQLENASKILSRSLSNARSLVAMADAHAGAGGGVGEAAVASGRRPSVSGGGGRGVRQENAGESGQWGQASVAEQAVGGGGGGGGRQTSGQRHASGGGGWAGKNSPQAGQAAKLARGGQGGAGAGSGADENRPPKGGGGGQQGLQQQSQQQGGGEGKAKAGGGGGGGGGGGKVRGGSRVRLDGGSWRAKQAQAQAQQQGGQQQAQAGK